jgi:plasmid stability protein
VSAGGRSHQDGSFHQLQAKKGNRSMTLIIQLPDKLEAALKAEANAHGVSPADYVQDILERELAPSLEDQTSGPPFKTGWVVLAKYGPAPSAEEIDANRAEMFRHFAEN